MYIKNHSPYKYLLLFLACVCIDWGGLGIPNPPLTQKTQLF